ncbi:MAG: hypothetical protein CSA95_09210 [Bacteroidetes bacterium]|nr:MAG: hypothetical protein CSA95_09210 [Bacteroidota bacterium]
MGLGKYILSRKFWINVGLIILITALLIAGTLWGLKRFTRHGQAFSVPDFTGVPFDSIQAYDPGHGFRYILVDSIYQKGAKRGSITLQNPAPGMLVKEGRKIYLTIIAKMPEKTPMPNLLDLSLRQALGLLKQHELLPGRLSYVPSFDRNAVLAQCCKGDTLRADTLILKGSVIDLTLGMGYGEEEAFIPFLIGKQPYKAREQILHSGFNKGEEHYLDTKKQSDVRVYRQEPEWEEGAKIAPGARINLYYRSIYQVNFDSLVMTYMAPDSLEIDKSTDVLDP